MKEISQKNKIIVSKNGPYLVSGKIPLSLEEIVLDGDGNPLNWEKGEKYPDRENYLLCRCGQSKNMPYCDDTHKSLGFDGTETAINKNYLEEAETLEGPDLDLKDCGNLCAGAGFCDRAGGTWHLTEHSDNPESKKIAIEQCGNCSSGRLTACDKKTGQAIEPDFEPSISVASSGPLWVKGGVPIESFNGKKYERRNRITLCRCGKSKNKPFCDGSHD